MDDKLATFLRYPGSKRRMLDFLAERLPKRAEIKGRFIEPFVGSGAVFFRIGPRSAILGDLNGELIDLYEGIRISPARVWDLYRSYPSTKAAYKRIRKLDVRELTLLQKAARSLYLNRTCFKGMWRTNKSGQFNVGYGGQDRRWVITRKDLLAVAALLRKAVLKCSDFEELIINARPDDFVFLDPPYRPGEREQIHHHYSGRQFSFSDHQRLACTLKCAGKRGVRWAITVSDHPDILKLYKKASIEQIPTGTSGRIGILTNRSGEVLITNAR